MTSYQLSARAANIKSSDVRDLLQYAGQADMISLAGGLPAAELFDVEGISVACDRALRQSSTASLQYGMTEGQASLKEALIRYLADKGISASSERLVITSGSQQALDLMARAMIDEGDTIAVERPTYLAALQAFNLCAPKYVSIGVDHDGGCVHDLENLPPTQLPKFVYVVTNFANPSGASMSLERRRWLVHWAVRNQVFVLEDDPYGDLISNGKPIASIASIASTIVGGTEWCGYTSTLSKCIAPGLRIGWLLLPQALAKTVAKVKQAVDLHTSSFTQEMAACYLNSGRIKTHLPKIQQAYHERRLVLEGALREHFGGTLTFASTSGGMFLWARFTDGTNTRDLLAHALKANVMFVPGDVFFTEQADTATLRMNFTGTGPEKLKIGVQRLLQAHKAYRAHRANCAV